VRHGVWRSLVARFVRDEEVAGSNPVTPTSVFPCHVMFLQENQPAHPKRALWRFWGSQGQTKSGPHNSTVY
jgi:hypothetical protein